MWVQYTPGGEWCKFAILKRGVIATLPQPTSSQKYSGVVELKEKNVVDLKKILDKYIPTEFKSYYKNLLVPSHRLTVVNSINYKTVHTHHRTIHTIFMNVFNFLRNFHLRCFPLRSIGAQMDVDEAFVMRRTLERLMPKRDAKAL